MPENPKSPPNFTATTSTPELEIRLVLKIPEFGNRYDVTTRQVHRWLVRGLPHLKLSPRNIRIPVSEGDHWVQQSFFRQRQRKR